MDNIQNRFSFFWLCFPLALMLGACSEQPQETEDRKSRPVKLFTVGEASGTQTLQFPGSVSAVKQSDMAFEVSGRIVEMPVTEGERVEADAVLAKLDPRDFESERARARAERNAARADFNRYNKAYQSGAVTPQRLDMARRALEVAEAELQRANKAVEDTVLRAPFEGRVARKLVEDYANVQAKQPVLILQSDDALEMQVDVPEADWVGQKPVNSAADIDNLGDIQVVLSALPDNPISAQVTAFSSTADPVTRTFEVTVRFQPPENLSVSPGMTGHVAYTPSPEVVQGGALLIPSHAVVAEPDNTPYIWLFDSQSGTVIKRSIEIGQLTGNHIQVLSGLAIGDRIAVSGVHTLTEGFPVHAWEG